MSTRTAQDIADDMRTMKLEVAAASATVARIQQELQSAATAHRDAYFRLEALRDEFEKLTNVETAEATTA